MTNKQEIRANGSTIEDAIQAGIAQLGVDRTQVKIEVIDEGSRGVLGIGKRDAIVRISLLENKVANQVDNKPIEKPVAIPPVVSAQPQQPPKPQPQQPPKSQSQEKQAQTTLSPLPPKRIDPVRTTGPVDQNKGMGKPKSADFDPDDETRVAKTLDEVKLEGETAQRFVTELLAILDIEADIFTTIDLDDQGEHVATVHLDKSADMDVLVGQYGNVLNEFQFIVRSMVSQNLHTRTNFMLDVDDFRTQRTESLIRLAKSSAKKAIDAGRPIALSPMPPYERRIIHMVLRNDNRVTTRSKGEGTQRRVTIIPNRQNQGNRRPQGNQGRSQGGGGGYSSDRRSGGGGQSSNQGGSRGSDSRR